MRFGGLFIKSIITVTSTFNLGQLLPPWLLVERLETAIEYKPPTIKTTCGKQDDTFSPHSFGRPGSTVANHKANPNRIEEIAP